NASGIHVSVVGQLQLLLHPADQNNIRRVASDSREITTGARNPTGRRPLGPGVVPKPVRSSDMNKSDLPASIRRFIAAQETCPVSEVSKVRKSTIHSPFSSYWYRAIACMMLSGRVQPRRYQDGSPNMTDVNRIGKEANFNQYLFDRVALTLATADIVVEGRF